MNKAINTTVSISKINKGMIYYTAPGITLCTDCGNRCHPATATVQSLMDNNQNVRLVIDGHVAWNDFKNIVFD